MNVGACGNCNAGWLVSTNICRQSGELEALGLQNVETGCRLHYGVEPPAYEIQPLYSPTAMLIPLDDQNRSLRITDVKKPSSRDGAPIAGRYSAFRH